MLTLILVVLLLWLGVTVLLSAWTVWFQGYIYSEPAAGIQWRGPAAGAAVTLVMLVWIVLDYRYPGACRTFFESASSEDSKPYPELRVPRQGGVDVYRLRSGSRLDYRLNGKPNGRPLPTRPPEVVAVIPGEEESVFKPERDAKGNFKTSSSSSMWFGRIETEPLRYIDGKGRVMHESSLGEVAMFHGDRVVGNLALNLVFLGVWFVSLWLLLQFQWPAALGQAVVFWGVMVLFVLPPVLTRAETVAKERAAARAQ